MKNVLFAPLRRQVLAGLGAVLLVATPAGFAMSQDLSGEMVILQWQGGVESDLWKKLEDAFVAKHPGVTVRELVVTGQGDMRGAMRTALMGGEVVDVIINTWPAFRAELLDCRPAATGRRTVGPAQMG